MKDISSWMWLLILAWVFIPAIPTIVEGNLLGSPYTDLYASVWSLHIPYLDPSSIFHTSWINYPQGQQIYSSALLKAPFAWLLSPFLSPSASYNLLLLCSRLAGPIISFCALRAWKFSPLASFSFAVCYSMAPFFHGYAVEGIIEGIDAWPLPLWLWTCAGSSKLKQSLSFALCILMSWYMGACVCMLALIFSTRHPRILYSFGGLALACPWIYVFIHTHPSLGEIDLNLRLQLTAQLDIPTPNLLSPSNPFAKNTYLGWVLPLLCLGSRFSLFALIPLALSFGIGADWPLLSAMRFPYRWHGATLFILAFALAKVVEKKPHPLIPLVLLFDFLFLSGVDLIIPSSQATIPKVYKHIEGPVLDIPGTFYVEPGKNNPARQRNYYLLYGQTIHQQVSLWQHDFNALNPYEDSILEPWLYFDPLNRKHATPEQSKPTLEDLNRLKDHRVGILIHTHLISRDKQRELEVFLYEHSWSVGLSDEEHLLYFYDTQKSP